MFPISLYCWIYPLWILSIPLMTLEARKKPENMRSGVEIGYLGVGSSSSYLTFTLQEEGSEAWSSSLMKRLCTQSESQISLKGANTGNLLWEYMIKRVCTSHIRGVSPTEAWMTEKRKHYCLLWARPTCPSLTPDIQKPGTP